MTAFVLVCVAMVLAALVWVAWPLLRPAGDAGGSRNERRVLLAMLIVMLPAAAGVLYARFSSWKWNDPEVERALEMSAQMGELQAAVREHPNDVARWTELGRAYIALGQFTAAINAYEKAHRLTGGTDPDTTASLAEALALSDESTLDQRAGRLFEEVLTRAPSHPKALFYSSIAAIRGGRLTVARDRLQMLLAQNPPARIRPLLERQVQDLDEQIRTGDGAVEKAVTGRVVKVAVRLAPALQRQLREPLTLFILARDPAAGGPPLAVERHGSSELPLTVELSAADAMLATHTLDTVAAVQVVARLSSSGTPQQQSGDYFGEARLEFDANKAKQEYGVEIVIDQRVP